MIDELTIRLRDLLGADSAAGVAAEEKTLRVCGFVAVEPALELSVGAAVDSGPTKGMENSHLSTIGSVLEPVTESRFVNLSCVLAFGSALLSNSAILPGSLKLMGNGGILIGAIILAVLGVGKSSAPFASFLGLFGLSVGLAPIILGSPFEVPHVIGDLGKYVLLLGMLEAAVLVVGGVVISWPFKAMLVFAAFWTSVSTLLSLVGRRPQAPDLVTAGADLGLGLQSAGFLAAVLVLLVLHPSQRGGVLRGLIVASVAALAALSGTRGLALAVAAGVLAGVAARGRSDAAVRHRVVGVLIAVLLGTFLFSVVPPELTNRALAGFSLDAVNSGSSDPSLRAREIQTDMALSFGNAWPKDTLLGRAIAIPVLENPEKLIRHSTGLDTPFTTYGKLGPLGTGLFMVSLAVYAVQLLRADKPYDASRSVRTLALVFVPVAAGGAFFENRGIGIAILFWVVFSARPPQFRRRTIVRSV